MARCAAGKWSCSCCFVPLSRGTGHTVSNDRLDKQSDPTGLCESCKTALPPRPLEITVLSPSHAPVGWRLLHCDDAPSLGSLFCRPLTGFHQLEKEQVQLEEQTKCLAEVASGRSGPAGLHTGCSPPASWPSWRAPPTGGCLLAHPLVAIAGCGRGLAVCRISCLALALGSSIANLVIQLHLHIIFIHGRAVLCVCMCVCVK